MRKLLALATIVLTVTAYTPSPKQYVYMCNSKASVAYHIDPNCSGLRHCKHGIFRTTRDSAINYYGRRACKICCQ